MVNAFTLPLVSLRAASEAQMTKWKISFRNLCALFSLRLVVEEGKPPERDAVIKNWPDLQDQAITQKLNECLIDYQRENTVLYYHVISSLDFTGEWEAHDLAYVDRWFVSGDLRDGNGLLKWFLAFHDLTTPAKQKVLRLKLGKFKIGLDLTQKQLLITLLNYLATWEKLLGNDRSDPVLLNDYYVRILDLWPCEPYDNPIVRTRSVAAHMHHSNDKRLDDVAATINEWMNAAKSYGVPIGKSNSNLPGDRSVLALGDRLTAADNDCAFCDVFNCKAQKNVKLCVVYNSAVRIGEGTPFQKQMQINFIKGARAHLKANPELETMKGVKFVIEKSSTPGGKGRGGGGRGGAGRGGGSAGRSATPIIMSNVGEAEFFGDDGENATDFESWVRGMQGEEAADNHLADIYSKPHESWGRGW